MFVCGLVIEIFVSYMLPPPSHTHPPTGMLLVIVTKQKRATELLRIVQQTP